MVLRATRLLAGGVEILNRQAILVGWCLEVLQASFLIADDIMDQSTTRRGKPCWYRYEGWGLGAINDSILLQSVLLKLLEREFKENSSKIYSGLLELFLDVAFKTELGQLMDLRMDMRHVKEDPYQHFTMKNYLMMIRYKTAFYSFYLPIALACQLSGKGEMAQNVRDILFMLGEHFQIQDDYLDCYGDVTVIGKIGTDIQEGKCSWLMVKALELLRTRQDTAAEKRLIQHYGTEDLDSVAKVKSIYKELDLALHYDAWRQDHEALIRKAILSLDTNDPFIIILDDICALVFQREK
jgi:farnesyl diphosphate synthase